MASGNDRDYRSRKFIVTKSSTILGTGMMIFGVLCKAPPEFWSAMPPFFLLLGSAIASYNWANLRESQNGSAPR